MPTLFYSSTNIRQFDDLISPAKGSPPLPADVFRGLVNIGVH